MAERTTRFRIPQSRWVRPIMVVSGFLERWSWVDVGPTSVEVRMSWGFRATVDRAAIVEIGRFERKVWSIGVHGWRGRWLVNGSTKGLVRLRIDPPAPARVCGIPLKLRELVVSVDDPDRVVDLLALGD